MSISIAYPVGLVEKESNLARYVAGKLDVFRGYANPIDVHVWIRSDRLIVEATMDISWLLGFDSNCATIEDDAGNLREIADRLREEEFRLPIRLKLAYSNYPNAIEVSTGYWEEFAKRMYCVGWVIRVKMTRWLSDYTKPFTKMSEEELRNEIDELMRFAIDRIDLTLRYVKRLDSCEECF